MQPQLSNSTTPSQNEIILLDNNSKSLSSKNIFVKNVPDYNTISSSSSLKVFGIYNTNCVLILFIFLFFF
jgi:hypothetical protein